MSIDAFMKNIQKLLFEAADALKETADRIYNISKSIENTENDFKKIFINDGKVETTPIEESKSKPIENATIGPPTRITPTITKEIPIRELPPIKPEITEQQELTEERKSLYDITDKISGLFEKLKEKVVVRTQESVEKGVSEKEKGLVSFKNQISNLNERFKNFTKKDEIEDLTEEQRKKALRDMAEAINILTEEYNKDFLPKE